MTHHYNNICSLSISYLIFYLAECSIVWLPGFNYGLSDLLTSSCKHRPREESKQNKLSPYEIPDDD